MHLHPRGMTTGTPPHKQQLHRHPSTTAATPPPIPAAKSSHRYTVVSSYLWTLEIQSTAQTLSLTYQTYNSTPIVTKLYTYSTYIQQPLIQLPSLQLAEIIFWWMDMTKMKRLQNEGTAECSFRPFYVLLGNRTCDGSMLPKLHIKRDRKSSAEIVSNASRYTSLSLYSI